MEEAEHFRQVFGIINNETTRFSTSMGRKNRLRVPVPPKLTKELLFVSVISRVKLVLH